MAAAVLKRAVLYCRVSTAGQDHGPAEWASIPRQQAKLTELAEREGYEVVEVLSEVYSGAKDTRPAFQALLALVETRAVEAVFVVAFDRLTRTTSMAELERVRDTFRLARVDLVTPTTRWAFSQAEADSPEGRLTFRLLGSVAGFEREVIRRRTQAGREAKAKAGHYYGHRVPFGYRVVFTPEGRKTFEVVEEQAAVVRQIFDWYLAGRGHHWIGRQVRDRGVPGEWGKLRISTIIRNATYAGLQEWRKPHKRRKGQATDGHAIVPSLDFPPIVPVEVWERARAMAAERAVCPRRHAVQRPLSGILRCPSCDRKMRSFGNVRHNVRRWYYICPDMSEVLPTPCPARRMLNFDHAHALVLDALKAELPRVLAQLEQRVARIQAEPPRPDAEAEVVALQAELLTLQQATQRVIRFGALGAITEAEMASQLATLRGETQRVEGRLAQTQGGPVGLRDHQQRHLGLQHLLTALDGVGPDHPDLRGLMVAALRDVRWHYERRGVFWLTSITLADGTVVPVSR